jgi:hypothetical protein
MSARVYLALAIVLTVRVAHAYPQFQLSKDQTCTSCHLSPAGGGLLSENGLATAETMSQFGTAPELFYNKVPTPSWLVLGGDLRGATGFDTRARAEGSTRSRVDYVTFPMQADLDATATFDAWSLHVEGGMQDPQYDNTAKTLFASREHWIQWQDNPGETTGLFVRAGRFMPVFGLRFVEHIDYDRRYGGTPLYGEAYGVAAEYIAPSWEVHATGFVHDPLVDSIEHGNGATLYAEVRVDRATSVGVESKIDVTPDDRKVYGGVTAKHYLAGTNTLIEAEALLVNQTIDLGGHDNQAVGYVLGSQFAGPFMIDLGLGVYAPDLHVRYLDQEAADLNVHWFATSHLELVWTNRFEMLELGEGGLSSGFSLLQIHYRL